MFISTSVTKVSKWDPLLQSLFSHIFAMASGFRCFHASGPIGSARGSLFLAKYAQIFFSIFSTYFTSWPVSRKWESAKRDIAIGNATFYGIIFKNIGGKETQSAFLEHFQFVRLVENMCLSWCICRVLLHNIFKTGKICCKKVQNSIRICHKVKHAKIEFIYA